MFCPKMFQNLFLTNAWQLQSEKKKEKERTTD